MTTTTPASTPAPDTLPDDLDVPLTHRFADAVPELALDWSAEPAPEPRLLVLDDDLAADLGLDPAALRGEAGLGLLTGTALPEGAHTVAQGYGGHQFGGWSPRLGDGRAVLLGELTDRAGRVRDLHLKGSGRTPWSRGGDGRATVGPMLREVVVSRSLHALGIPTTRSLAVVATGRAVQREEPLPGAVLTRVAASHLRVGSFQHARALVDAGDADASLLARLADLAIERHHPQAGAGATAVERHTALYDAVVGAQARLVAQWMLVGFVHGVLNTDNVLISGESIDFGPCAFLDAHDPAAVFSSIDQAGRYAFGNQPAVTAWNLARLGEAMLPLLVDGDDAGAQDRAVAVATDVLSRFAPRFAEAFVDGMRAKLGLPADVPDEVLRPLVEDLQALLREAHADHTGFFRALAAHARGQHEAARGLVLDLPAYDAWAQRWLALGPDAAAMDRVNPLYIPRNHLVEEALAAAVEGDLGPFEQLLDVVSHPYDERPGLERHTQPAPDDLGPYTTYCGT